MQVARYTRYGSPDNLHITDLPKPAPKAKQVLIRIHATTVTAAECFGRRGESPTGRLIMGLRGPRPRFQVMGMELAGEVETVGEAVTRFKVGDAVYGFTGIQMGANAEYTCMNEGAGLALKPTNLSFAEAAAAVDGPTTALFFLRDYGHLQPNQHVLIIGASGSIGTYAVQLAKHFGAEVTGVCSGANVELVKSLGADTVIDYTREDFTQRGVTYDLIFDTVGKSTFGACKPVLKPDGRYLVTTGNMLRLFIRSAWSRLFSRQKLIFAMSIDKRASLEYLRGLFEDDTLKPVIDRSYPLAEIAAAHHYVDTGRKRGNVVITMP